MLLPFGGNKGSAIALMVELLAAGLTELDFTKLMGFLAVTLASVNIFGGYIDTNRMLGMFKKKKN